MNQPASLLNTPKKTLRATMVFFIAIVVGIGLFMLVAVLINQMRGSFQPDFNQYKTPLVWSMAVFSIVCFIAAKRIFNKRITAAKNSLKPLNDKLNEYRLALIRYLAICELPAIFNILLFLITGNFVFQVFSAVLIGFMLAVTPLQRRVIAQLELDWQQQKELE